MRSLESSDGGFRSPQVGTLMLLEDFAAADRWVCHGLEARIGAALMPSRCCLIRRCLLVGCNVDLTPSIQAAMGDGFLAPIGARGRPPSAEFMAWTAHKWSELMKSTRSWTRWGLPFFGPDRMGFSTGKMLDLEFQIRNASSMTDLELLIVAADGGSLMGWAWPELLKRAADA
ncbi:hypothetical protein ACLOJK_022147 [Asimina triloba]